MKAITQENLLSLLSEVKGATFATLVTNTDPKLRKTGNTLGTVRKVSRVNVTLGFQYEAAVNRQRTREGTEADFEAAPRQWGQKISPMFVENKGKIYLETKVEKSLGHSFQDATGKEIDSKLVEPFLPARSESSRQETEKEILVRDYALESIVGISFKGEDYIVTR
jgi:hypothetical protein